MSLQLVVAPYKNGLAELSAMVCVAEKDVIRSAAAASILTGHINFFTKSFLISACAHLEMCIKEIIFYLMSDIDVRLTGASVPFSALEWRYGAKKRSEQPMLAINMTRKEVDDLVSGNVYRTKEALSLVGIDISKDKYTWEAWKDVIQGIVTRRNNIVHHNDNASDISFGDVQIHISSMIEYIEFLVEECKLQAA